jgi:PAT family beta-lactamase induction signal transducer AmpG
MSSKPSLLQVLSSPRIWLLVALGFASGLPLLLVTGTLSIWMKNEGVNLKTIGIFTLVSMPYALKFLWAPFLDRYALPFLGRRRGWMLVTQLGLAAGIAFMGTIDPKEAPFTLACASLLVAFLSASQDVVIDAWRTDILTAEERGLGASTYTMGYRFGIIAASPLALTLSDKVGWYQTYQIMAGLMLLGTVGTFFAREPQVARPPRNLRDAVLLPFGEYFRRPGAIAVLLFLLLYKLGEAFAGPSVTGPFVSSLGFTNTEIGAINKLPSMIAAITGGLLGGALMIRLSMRRCLYLFGALQALTNLTFLALALVGKNYWMLVGAAVMDNLCGGMATTAFVAYLTSLCNKRFSATQYALLSALATLGGRLVSATWGILVTWMGWPAYFVLTVFLAAPALILLAFLRPDAAAPKEEEVPPGLAEATTALAR